MIWKLLQEPFMIYLVVLANINCYSVWRYIKIKNFLKYFVLQIDIWTGITKMLLKINSKTVIVLKLLIQLDKVCQYKILLVLTFWFLKQAVASTLKTHNSQKQAISANGVILSAAV